MLGSDSWVSFEVQALFALLLVAVLVGLIAGLAVWAVRSRARCAGRILLSVREK